MNRREALKKSFATAAFTTLGIKLTVDPKGMDVGLRKAEEKLHAFSGSQLVANKLTMKLNLSPAMIEAVNSAHRVDEIYRQWDEAVLRAENERLNRAFMEPC